MANQPGGEIIEFHIRKVKQGTVSGFVHDTLRPGDRVHVEGPFGSSYLREAHGGSIVAVAGGSGLAPVLSIIGSTLGSATDRPIHVYVGARTVEDLYGLETLNARQGRHGNLKVETVLSEGTDRRFRPGLVGEAVRSDLRDMDGWKAYVAGPPPMVDAVREVAKAAGLSETDFHADEFFTPEEAAH